MLVLHEFDKVRELKLLLARVLKDLAPLFKRIQKDSLSIELVLLCQNVNLGLLTKAIVVKHGHAFFQRLLDETLDASIKLGVIRSEFIDCFNRDDEHVGLTSGTRTIVHVALHNDRVLAEDGARHLDIVEHKVLIMQ